MLAQRRQAADRVAASLFEAEAALAEAVKKVAGLVTDIQTARADANLSMVVGSEAAFRSIACLRALGDAGQEIVQTHHELADTKRLIGLGATKTPGEGGGDKPKNNVTLAAPSIEAVAA